MNRTPDFTLVTEIPASPASIYDAWIDGAGHAAMTGAPASSVPEVGGRFTAWEGYIEGTWSELAPGARIGMRWRTMEFPAEAPAADVAITLEAGPRGTRLTLVQSGTPAGQAENYRVGWEDHYFAPMRAHFGASQA